MPEPKENTKKRIGILRGGTGRHYKSSLQKGGEIISHLSEKLGEKYKPVDVLIDRDHIWHVNGVPIVPGNLVHKIDMAWNLSHPSFSNILTSLAIPTVGSGSFLGALMNDREMFRKHIKDIGVAMPRHIVLPVYQKDFDGDREKYPIKKAKEIFDKFSSPWIVKSLTSDYDMGIHIAKTFPALINAIEDGVARGHSIIIEEFISDKVASLHSVLGFRGEDIYTFPVVSISGSFSSNEREKLSEIAKYLHKHIDAEHYLKSDFALNSRGKVYLLSVELHPDLKKDSHFHQVCESVGAKAHHVVEHILEGA